nr:MAG TPA: tail protein [Bacteriophage sp.]
MTLILSLLKLHKIMVKINGSSFALQYKRTTGRPIDSTETFKTLEDATSYARNTDAEEYFPYAGQIISVEIGEGVYKLVKDDSISEEDGRKHYRLSPIITEEESGNKYLSKIEDDEARGLITFLAGINVKIKAVIQKLIAEYATFSKEISSKDYVQNLLGWLITPEGHIDAKSLRLRDFLEVPELRYNRVSIVSGEEWNAPGGGIIESVDVANKTVHLKLEPGEVSQVEIDDICKGVFNNDTGFQTAYFRITEKIDNASFKYVLRSGYTFNPCKAMHFVAYGNFTNAERQKSCYSTQNYIRFLKGVNNWEITKDMIAMQLGDLSNLKLFGIDMSGHSAYLNRVYMTGTIRQISSDGVTEAPVPVFKGEWKSGTYWYYDEVTHNGSTWICIESTTTQEPSDSSTDWLKSISKGDTGSQGAPGKDGIPGKDGADGKTSYFHIKYSPVQNPTASQMTDTPNKYIGTYVDFVQASSSDPSKYTWAKFEGGDGIPGTNGENGKTSYLHIKYSDDGKTFTANNGETPGVYMGVYVDFVQADSNVFADYTWSKIKGEAGKDGKGLQSVDVLYYLSSSSTSLSGGSWSTNSPTWVDGKYIWSKTKVVYTDGSSIETNPACITGGKGSTGDNGRGVSSIVEEYYLSTSSNSLVGGSWSTTPPTWENGKYIWTRSVITYTDSASTTTDPICVTGGKGATGIGVKSVSEQYYLSTSYSTTTGGSWSTTVPAWKDGKYIWTRSIITYTDNSYTETNPVCVTGGKGPSGNDGVGISAVDVLYYLSTSSSSLVGGSWSSTSPTWQNGKYLWSKTKVTYTDNSTWESDPVCITGSQGKTGLPGAMLRPRGVWAPNTEYYHNDAFIDTVIYNGQNKLCKITHTSTSSFDSTKWEEFSEFVNVATNVLLAQNATIDVLGTSGIFVGNLEKTEGWMITEGGIKHNQTGFELTPDGGINTANGQLILTANSTLIRTNTGKDIALFKEVDGVPMIDAKNINTENLVVTTGAKIGAWEIKDGAISSWNVSNAKILLEISGTRFLRINEYGGVIGDDEVNDIKNPLLSIRNDSQDCVSLSTYGQGGVALNILANSNGGAAIRSFGSHVFGCRSKERWNAPGVLAAGTSNGSSFGYWSQGAPLSARKEGTGRWIITHNLGTNDYYVMITAREDSWDTWAGATIRWSNANEFAFRVRYGRTEADFAWDMVIIGNNSNLW